MVSSPPAYSSLEWVSRIFSPDGWVRFHELLKNVSPLCVLRPPTYDSALTDPPQEHPMNANRRTILRWLTTRLAVYLEVSPTTIDLMVPLAEMGVDSVHAISLVGDVEAHFDIDVDPTMIFDYPTLSHIAEYISTTVGERQEAVA
jgi:acyl carrier protein